MARIDLGAALPGAAPTEPGASGIQPDTRDWSWPPYGPLEAIGEPLDIADWAPSSTVRHPRLRVGRWTVLYRRSG